MADWKDRQSQAALEGTKYGKKLMALAVLLQAETQHRLREQNLDCEANLHNAQTWVKFGNTYDKIDIGNSGRLMVEARTETIYGIKGYGKVHKGHVYGTLDTIDDWFWGEYYPVRKSRKADEETWLGRGVFKVEERSLTGKVVGIHYEGPMYLKVRWTNGRTETLCPDKVKIIS